MNVVLATGGFDPIHSGHISYLNHAEHLGDWLVVGLNSDEWLTRKKGKPFMSWHERMVILDNLHMVDRVIDFDDTDGTARDAIRKVKQMFPDDRIIFANGGDRTKDNIPEMQIDDPNLTFVFGVGGEDKKNSSSCILKEWKNPQTERPWGYYRVLYDKPGTKVKELIIQPNQSLSMQRHAYRSEYWFVTQGSCQVETEYSIMQVNVHDEQIKIPAGSWHRLSNPYEVECHLVEVQYGSQCIENDIERK